MGLLLGSISVMNPIRSGWAIEATEDDLSEFSSSVRLAIICFCFFYILLQFCCIEDTDSKPVSFWSSSINS